MSVHAFTPEYVAGIPLLMAVAIGLAGTWFMVAAWGYGRPGRFLSAWAGEAFRNGTVSFLRTLVLDALLFRRIWRRSRFRWAVHMSIFWVFVILGAFMVISAVGLVLAFVDPMGPGGACFQALSDLKLPYSLLAYPLVAGSCLAIGRRLLLREVRGLTLIRDFFILGSVLLIGLTGMIAEWFSGFDVIMGSAMLDWDLAIAVLMVHIYATFLLFIMLIPWTRFRHIIATPLVILARRGGD
jgi:heterodisulfide reductase subunit E